MVLLYSLGAGLSSFSENFLKRWIGSCPAHHSLPAGHEKRRCEKIIHSAFISLASAGFHRLVTSDGV